MADTYCRLIFPRDGLTCKILRGCLPASAKDKVLDLGNPMMDGLEPTGVLALLKKHLPAHVLTLLPGSRSPEVFANWYSLLEATNSVATIFPSVIKIFVVPVVPSLPMIPFIEAILEAGWHWSMESSFMPSDCKPNPEMHEKVNCSTIGSGMWIEREMPMFSFQKGNAMIILLKGGFSDAISWADAGIAMAGTATEQIVGLGKPVFTLAGKGPQFTYEFAEAQARLLGKSVILCIDGAALATRMQEILSNKESLLEISENGSKRMGNPGASKRIAERIWSLLRFGCSFSL